MARLSHAEQAELLSIKRLCYSGLSSERLRASVAERLGRATHADAFVFLALDPGTGLPTHAVYEGWPDNTCQVATQEALLRSPAADFSPRARQPRRAYLVEQLVTDDLGSDPYVANVLFGFGFTHELQVACVGSGRAWGNLMLQRRGGRGQFESRDLPLLDAIAPHVTAGLRAANARAMLAASSSVAGEAEGQVSASKSASMAGVVVLGPHGGIELANGKAEQLLNRPSTPEHPGYWVAVQTVAGLLVRSLQEDGAGIVPSVTIVDSVSGERYRLHGERVYNASGEPRGLILIEPARADRTEALLDLGLTPRESEVALAVIQGQSTAEIAEAMVVSAHTVREYVRNVFDKLEVSSRRELAAKLLGVLT